MKIGLYDVDSTIPNLALMKLSRYYKMYGHDVSLYQPLLKHTYDKIYVSKIFSFSSDAYIDYDLMEVGGTGTESNEVLPEEIEGLQPDYSLYGYPHNIGFTMRGCRLKCSFCVVPKKEGGPKPENKISEIWTQRDSDFIVLLDNDFFGNPEWGQRIDELVKYSLKVNFSQGLNIRNIKPEQAKALASVSFRNLKNTAKQVYFAWDDPRHEKLIHKGINICLEAGIKPTQMAFYVLIGYHSTEEQDLHRVNVLKQYGADPFVMPFDKENDYQKRFARWVNHKAIFNSVEWSQYRAGIKKATQDRRQINLIPVVAEGGGL